jgi:hypothetical protein
MTIPESITGNRKRNREARSLGIGKVAITLRKALPEEEEKSF